MPFRFYLFLIVSATVLAAQTAEEPILTESFVREQLKSDAVALALGVVFLALALSCALISFLRWEAKEWALPTLGVFAALYGTRMLFLEVPTVAFLLLDLSPATVDLLHSLIDYVILVPAWMFARQMLGDGWKSSLRWLVRVQVAFASVAVLSDLAQGEPYSVQETQRALVLAGIVVITGNLFWVDRLRVPGGRLVTVGLGLFSVAVVLRNLGADSQGLFLEPTALLLFVLTLGYSVTLRIFAREKRLLAIEQELETARQIQTSILPRGMPLTQGVEIAVRYLPMTEVAGDFYDFLELDSSRLGLLVADVSGHGVPAALVASMVKVGFGVQRSHASDPSRVLAGLNQVLYGQLDGQFVTAGYLYIDTEGNKLRYAGAAHPPLLLCNRATGKVEALEENGLMLGPFPQPEYQNVEIEFNAGERIVLVTDGILEAADASGEFFGEERLREFVAIHSRLGVESFADELLQEVTRWSASDAGAEQSDDITLAVVDIGGLPSSRREPIATNAEENDHSDR